MLSGLPRYLKCLVLGSEIKPHSCLGWCFSSCLSMSILTDFSQAIKSKADNQPSLDGALRWQPSLSGSTDNIKMCSVKEF